MKIKLTLMVFAFFLLFNGCYTVSSLQDKPKEIVETYHSNNKVSKDYFDEESYSIEIDSSYELVNTDSLEEAEHGFFENIIAEIISGLSNISYNDDNLIMIFSADNLVYIVNTDNSSSTEENSSTEPNNTSTRNSNGRNYNSRK